LQRGDRGDFVSPLGRVSWEYLKECSDRELNPI
jgi:hypothetical protein